MAKRRTITKPIVRAFFDMTHLPVGKRLVQSELDHGKEDLRGQPYRSAIQIQLIGPAFQID